MEKMPLRNGGLYSKEEYVGKTYEEAKKYAEEGGFTTRVVEEDGNALMLEHNVNARRMNFRTRSGFVIDAFAG
jgi:hypothetical protein